LWSCPDHFKACAKTRGIEFAHLSEDARPEREPADKDRYLQTRNDMFAAAMSKVLVTWVGRADCDASEGKGRGVGPVAQALESCSFDRAVLLCNYPKETADAYLRWLKKRTQTRLVMQPKSLRSPTHLGDIYLAVSETLEGVLKDGAKDALELTFHTSPGTGPMAAVWIILARSKYRATLLTSSLERGTEELDAPFDLAADFVMGQVSRFEQGLGELAEGRPAPDAAFGDIIHGSRTMQVVVERAQVVAKLTAPVLIEGESGTGKELFARAIHQASERRSGPFVAVNCGAIPRELVQSILFGHVKSSFTGATSDRKGHFREAQGGTLFLDEIGELSAEHQVHLLRVLQERKVMPVGGSREIDVDVRIIAATHRRLADEVAQRRFREDLYYRLAMLVLHLPPLRERAGDLTLLIERLLPVVASRLGTQHKKLSVRAKNLMLRHDWPGNVRELEGVLARALAWSKGDSIDEAEMREALLLHEAPAGRRDPLNHPLGHGFSLNKLMHEVARHYLERAQADAGGVKKQAAELLGFGNYQTYDNWYSRYVLEKG